MRRPPHPRSLLLVAAAALGVAIALVAAGGARTSDIRGETPTAAEPPAPAPAPPQASVPPVPPPSPGPATPAYPDAPSVAVGRPNAGRLVRGVLLPAEGPDHATWHPIRKAPPNAAWRRHGTDRLVRTVLRVAREHRAAYPDAPRLLIGDLSRPRGGDFGAAVAGGLGHASHQNGLDIDVYYPRADRLERRPYTPSQIDRVLAQDLVDRFVAAGAQYVFVGPRTGLTGPRKVVQPLVHHDDHLHVRLPAQRSR